MGPLQFFCDDHWNNLRPKIERGDVNGVALQPLAMDALLCHDGVRDTYAQKIDGGNQVGELLSMAAPACCELEGRTFYADQFDGWEDDYQILLAAGSSPLDELPDAWWPQNRDEHDDEGFRAWWEWPEGIHVQTGDDTSIYDPDGARVFADQIEESLDEDEDLRDDVMAFVSDIREAADEYEAFGRGGDE